MSAPSGQQAAGARAGAPATATHRPPLRRLPDEGSLAGVCAGLALHLRVDVRYVQAAFVVLTVFGGIGFAVYALAWALLPAVHTKPPAQRRQWTARGGFARELAGIALLAAAGLLALRQVGFWFPDTLLWPLALAGAGAALIWRQAEEAAAWTPAELRHPLQGIRDRMRAERGADGRRTALGVTLIGLAALLLLRETGALRQVGNALGGIVVLAIAVGLIFGPYLARLARSLADERTERIRSQERAEVAAHLHDSVLQTLALIQKRAEDPREVASLARRQERELRNWLQERPAQPEGGAWRRRWRRSRPRSSSCTACRSRSSPSATVPSTRSWRRSCRRRERRSTTPPSSPAARRSTSTPRSPTGASRCSCATAVSASIRRRFRPTAVACASRSSGGWSATAAGRRSPRRPVPARRSS